MKMKELLRKILAMGIVALFLGATGSAFFKINISVNAQGVTVYVDDDNTDGPWDGTLTHPYQNITSGLAHASDGDAVYVQSGNYHENVFLNKSVTLKGYSKPIIDAMGGIGINMTIDESFTYGVTVDGFDITNSSYGVYLMMQDIENLNGTSVTIGDIVVADNRISSSVDGFYVYVNEVGYNMSGNSSVVMGDFNITGNVVSCGNIGIFIDSFYNIGSYMYNSSSFMMGNLDFSNNTIDSGSYGLYLDDLEYIGYMMHDESQFTMGSILTNENTIHSGSYGIYVYGIYDVGEYMYGASYFSMGSIEFDDN